MKKWRAALAGLAFVLAPAVMIGGAGMWYANRADAEPPTVTPRLVLRSFVVPWDWQLMAEGAGEQVAVPDGWTFVVEVEAPLRFSGQANPHRAVATTGTISVDGEELDGAAVFHLEADSDAARAFLRIGKAQRVGYDLIEAACTSLGPDARRLSVDSPGESAMFFLAEPVSASDAIQCDLYYTEPAPLQAIDLNIAGLYSQEWTWTLDTVVNPAQLQVKPNPWDNAGATFDYTLEVTSSRGMTYGMAALAEVTFLNQGRSPRSLAGVQVRVPGATGMRISDGSGNEIPRLADALVPAAAESTDGVGERDIFDGTVRRPGSLTVYLDITYDELVDPVIEVDVPLPADPSQLGRPTQSVTGGWTCGHESRTEVVLTSNYDYLLFANYPQLDPNSPAYAPLQAVEDGHWSFGYSAELGGNAWSRCLDFEALAQIMEPFVFEMVEFTNWDGEVELRPVISDAHRDVFAQSSSVVTVCSDPAVVPTAEPESESEPEPVTRR